jgi:hypothetical protein
MLAILDLMSETGGQMQSACPSCGKPLRITRITPRPGGDLRTYGCQQCGVWLTEAADEPIGRRDPVRRRSARQHVGARRLGSGGIAIVRGDSIPRL